MPQPLWRGATARFLTRTLLVTGTSIALASGGAVALAQDDESLADGAGTETTEEENAETLDGPPGDNGTVKVHDSETPADTPRNEPHVCDFYIVGFNFDGEQEISWKIKAWPPTGDGEVVLTGDLTLDESGHGRTDDYELPDGHYKLYWKFEGEHGAGKHKVFWVDCEDEGSEPEPTPSPTPEPSPSPSQSPSTPPEEEPPSSPSPEPTEPDDVRTPDEEEEGEEAAGENEGGLPVTGAALGGLIAAAVAALGGGGAAMYLSRRRKAGMSEDGTGTTDDS